MFLQTRGGYLLVLTFITLTWCMYNCTLELRFEPIDTHKHVVWLNKLSLNTIQQVQTFNNVFHYTCILDY